MSIQAMNNCLCCNLASVSSFDFSVKFDRVISGAENFAACA